MDYAESLKIRTGSTRDCVTKIHPSKTSEDFLNDNRYVYSIIY